MIIDNRYYRIKSIFGYRLRALVLTVQRSSLNELLEHGERHLRMFTSWSMTLPPLGQCTSSCWKEDKGGAKGVKRLRWSSSWGRWGGCSASRGWEARLGAWSNDSAVQVLVLPLPREGGNGFLMRSRGLEGKEWPTLSAWCRDIMP